MFKSVCSAVALIAFASASFAQSADTQLKPVAVQAAGTQATNAFLPANTDVVLSMNDDLTTKGGNLEEGTLFYLTNTADVKLKDMIVIPKGARGAGEVTWRTGKGAFGKSGKMEVELKWVEVGGQRIPLEGKYRQEGEGNTVATVGAVVAAGVFAAFVTGKSARIPRGRELVAKTKVDVPVALPVAADPAPQPAPTATQ